MNSTGILNTINKKIIVWKHEVCIRHYEMNTVIINGTVLNKNKKKLLLLPDLWPVVCAAVRFRGPGLISTLFLPVKIAASSLLGGSSFTASLTHTHTHNSVQKHTFPPRSSRLQNRLQASAEVHLGAAPPPTDTKAGGKERFDEKKKNHTSALSRLRPQKLFHSNCLKIPLSRVKHCSSSLFQSQHRIQQRWEEKVGTVQHCNVFQPIFSTDIYLFIYLFNYFKNIFNRRLFCHTYVFLLEFLKDILEICIFLLW